MIVAPYLVLNRDPRKAARHFCLKQSTSAAATSVSHSFVNNAALGGGDILLLTAICCLAVPGAGQNISNSHQLDMRPPNSTEAHHIDGEGTAGAANINRYLAWQGELLLFPDWTLVGSSNFNAAGAANTIHLTAFGYWIPRGTFLG